MPFHMRNRIAYDIRFQVDRQLHYEVNHGRRRGDPHSYRWRVLAEASRPDLLGIEDLIWREAFSQSWRHK